MNCGEMAEWSKAPHSKCGVPVTVPRVRIPISPPVYQKVKLTVTPDRGDVFYPAMEQPARQPWLIVHRDLRQLQTDRIVRKWIV